MMFSNGVALMVRRVQLPDSLQDACQVSPFNGKLLNLKGKQVFLPGLGGEAQECIMANK